MIVVDLDGTLLRSDKTISDRSLNVLKRCQELDVKVVYATARGESADRVAPAEYFDARIAMGGATAKIGDEVVYSRRVLFQDAKPILIACEKRGIAVTAESGSVYYTNKIVPDFDIDMSRVKFVDFEKHNIDSEKMYILQTTANEREFLRGLITDGLHMFVYREDGFVTISHKEAMKSHAVQAVAEVWDIKSSEIVAFGDDLIDIPLLEYAGIGVAMGNALDEVKAAADEVCLTNDEDGVATWILNNLPGRK